MLRFVARGCVWAFQLRVQTWHAWVFLSVGPSPLESGELEEFLARMGGPRCPCPGLPLGKEGVAFTFSTHIPHLASGVSQVRHPLGALGPLISGLRPGGKGVGFWRPSLGGCLQTSSLPAGPFSPWVQFGGAWGRALLVLSPPCCSRRARRPGACSPGPVFRCFPSSSSSSLSRNTPPGGRGQARGVRDPLCPRPGPPERPRLPPLQFSSLREEKKWEEVKGLSEKDNLLLRQVPAGRAGRAGRARWGAHPFRQHPAIAGFGRDLRNSERVGCPRGAAGWAQVGLCLRAPPRPQQVWELERELQSRERALAESDAKVGQLQAQAAQSQKQQQSWQQLQEATRDKMEAVQQAEQQTRVALESAQSRVRVPLPQGLGWQGPPASSSVGLWGRGATSSFLKCPARGLVQLGRVFLGSLGGAGAHSSCGEGGGGPGGCSEFSCVIFKKLCSSFTFSLKKVSEAESPSR